MASLALSLFRKENSGTTSLLGRIKAVGQSLKSMKPADVAWMGGNAVVGMAASKIGVSVAGLIISSAGLSAVGVIAAGTAAALAGGALSGAARGVLAHIKQQSQIQRTEKRTLLEAFKQESKALYHSQEFRKKVMWGSLTAGLFGGLTSFAGTELGQSLAHQTKDMLGHFAKNLHLKLPFSAAIAAPLPQNMQTVIPQNVEAVSADPVPVIKEAKADLIETAQKSLRTETTESLSKQTIAKASLVVPQADLTNHYTTERLRQLIKDTTGIEAPENASPADLAKQFHANNPEAFLKGLEQQAPQMNESHLAASCEIQPPERKGGFNIINTLCQKFKGDMGANDIVIVTNANPAVEPSKGIRVLYRQAVSALGGVVAPEKTIEFLQKNVTEAGGAIEDMVQEAPQVPQAVETADGLKLPETAPSL